jgi:hypothetical protein
MLLILRSTALSCTSTSAFPVFGASVMDAAPEPVPVVVVPPDVAPLELAVPAELMPGGGGDATLAALPAPLGSLTELLRPPVFAGPAGTPLIDEFPAPAEPALGEPAADPLPADAPLALCANEVTGAVKIAITASVAGAKIFVMENSFHVQRQRALAVPRAGTNSGCCY